MFTERTGTCGMPAKGLALSALAVAAILPLATRAAPPRLDLEFVNTVMSEASGRPLEAFQEALLAVKLPLASDEFILALG